MCAVATYLQKLVVLRLGWCKEVTDWGLLGMVQRAKCEPDEETVRIPALCRCSALSTCACYNNSL